jgi:hypothetical protein
MCLEKFLRPMLSGTLVFFLFLTNALAATVVDTARTALCAQGLKEQKPQLSPKITLTPVEEADVIKQCEGWAGVYWFSQALYIQARNAGDSHSLALNEFRLFNGKSDLVFTIPDYTYFRVVLHNTNLPYLLRLQAFQDVLDVRKKYRSYP